jgi:transmembrane sensor
MNNRLHYLLERYVAGTETAEEHAELLQLIHSADQELPVKEWMEQHWQQLSQVHTLSFERTGRLFEFITAAEEQQTPGKVVHRVHFMRRWRWVAAASVILILGVATFLWINNVNRESSLVHNETNNKPVDIAPGGNKAILTLSDGSTITLDSATNGTIAQQGNADVVKLADGQVEYKLKGNTAGQVLMNTMSTPRGGQYQLTLPDGTKVWLNAASSITYPAVFVGRERNVKVTGEAYFEVAKNKEKPFIVDVDGKNTVEVLGTHFNVNAYNDEDESKVTLLEGSVKVSVVSARPDDPVGRGQLSVLNPGQQSVLTHNSQLTTHNAVDLEQVMAWKNGMFEFNKTDLRTIMRQISRWYDVDIQYNGKPTNELFGGGISRNLPLTNVLKLLETNGVQFSRNGKTVIVTP